MMVPLALAIVAVVLLTAPAEAEVVDLDVPYHRQVTSWYCAEASLKMVFDYWGEEIPQHDIGDVANEREVGGTYATDLVRAARFSNISTSIQYREGGGSQLQGYDQRPYGYAAHVNQWSDTAYQADRYTDLMELVREGYPVIMLCWLDAEHQVTHFRVIKGFDTGTGDFLVHDPALGSNLRFNMTLLVDDLWTYYDRWAMVVVPWRVNVTAPQVVGPGGSFTVTARVEFPCPSPFDEVEKVYTWPQEAKATITVPPPFYLAEGENATVPLNMTRGGDSDTVNWTVDSHLEAGYWAVRISVVAEATVTDSSVSYGWYTDTVGGVGDVMVTNDAVPPLISSFTVAGGEDVVRDPLVAVAFVTTDLHSSVDTVSLSVDGGVSWLQMGTTTGGFDVRLDGGDGTYDVQLRVTDVVGNTASISRSVVLDTTPPEISIFQMAGGEEVVTTHNVQATLVAEDAISGIDLMALRVGDAPWGPWEPYREEIQLDLPTDGTWRVDVRIRDGIGNTATATDSVTVDTTAPRIERFEVARGLAYSNTSQVQVVIGASDDLDGELDWSLHEETVSMVQFDPGNTVARGELVTVQWTFGGEGSRRLTLTVRDHAGLTADASATVVVDTQPPRITLVLNAGRPVTTVPEIPVAVDVTDATSESVRARIRVNSNAWGPWSDPSSFRRVGLGPGEGTRTVHVQAQDVAGNLAETSGSVMVDTMSPTVTVTFTSTRPGGVVAGDSDILLEFSEPMDVDTVTVVLTDNSTGVLECDLEWSGEGDELMVGPKAPLPRGSHFVLQVSGEDLVGNQLDFRGVVFSTPEVEGDDWNGVISGDSPVLLLVVALVIVLVFAVAFGLTRRQV
jgi:hypothetical protein